MAAELRERIARVIDPDCWEQIDRDAHLLPDKVKTDWVKAQPSLAKADAALALLPQPSPGEYAGLIEEAGNWLIEYGEDDPETESFPAGLIRQFRDALSSALRERDEARSHAAAWQGICDTIATILGLSLPEADFAAVVRAKFDAVTRERDMIAAVNTDWSAYDKGVREAGKALVDWFDAGGSLSEGNVRTRVQALRSALSLVPER